MSSNAHLLAPVGMLLVVTVLWSALAGAVWWRNACILLLLGVGGYIIVQQPQPQPQQPQPAAEKVEKEKEKSQKEKEPVAAASSGADEDALSVASDGALSDVNSAIAPIAASAESVPDEDSTTADEPIPLDTDTPETDDYSFAAVLSAVEQDLDDDATSNSSPSTAGSGAIPPIASQSAAAAATAAAAPNVANAASASTAQAVAVSSSNATVSASTAASSSSGSSEQKSPEEKPALLAWEELQRAAEAEAARAEAAQKQQKQQQLQQQQQQQQNQQQHHQQQTALQQQQHQQQLTEDADSLDDLLADVAASDPEADVDAEVRVSAATAETDSTEKAVEFWGHFEEKAAAAAAVAAAQDTSIHSASSTSGASDESGVSALDVARAMSESSRPLPDKFSSFSTSGIVKCGHVDIDSENEEDEALTDTVISGSSRFDIGFADTKGVRSTMEDEMVVYGTFRDSPDEDYVAVFDGHGGSDASAVAAEELHELLATHLDAPQHAGDPGAALKAAFESCQRTIEQAEPQIQSGTTAVVAYFQGQRGWVANAGDSRAIVCRRAKGVAQGSVGTALDFELTRVTTDHKPSLPAEEARIKAAGGFVTRTQTKRGEVSRVCAILGVARALGDTFLQPMVTCMPDVFDVPFAQYDALILACDGLWDVVSDAEAAAVTLNAADAGDAARRLRDFAIARNSDDNISVLVVFFKPK